MAMNIKHVKGNLLRLAIPLTITTKTTDGGQETSITEDFIPNLNYPITVRLGGSYLSYSFDATMDGNIAIMEDNGTLPKGVYQVEVLCKDDNGNNCRFMQRNVIDVVDATIEAGIVIGTEFEVETHYLDAAVFIRGEKGDKGEKGDTGDTFFATFEVNEDMDLVMTRYNRDSLSMEVVDGYLYEVVDI